ncbi:MAG TPA: hypothetical protein VGB20_07735 [bacterium]
MSTPRAFVLQLFWAASLAALGGYWVARGALAPGASADWGLDAREWLRWGSAALYVAAWWWARSRVMNGLAARASRSWQVLAESDRRALSGRLFAASMVAVALPEAPVLLGLLNSAVGSPAPRLFEWTLGATAVMLLWLRVTMIPAVCDALAKLATDGTRSHTR